MKYGNFIQDVQIQIENDFDFSICATPLYVAIVIFGKRIPIESRI